MGIIGAGNNAAGHAKYYRDSERTELVGVADIDTERAKALTDECGGEAMSDYRSLLDVADAVVVSSPNFLHCEHAVAAAQAGLAVFCEKPMGLSLDQARQIAQAVNTAGVASAVGFSVGRSAAVQTMLNLRDAGKLGELISIWSRRLMYLNPEKLTGWRADPSKSGGLLLEINIHEIEWMMRLGGNVESVYARMRAEEGESPPANDHLWITLNFQDNVTGLHEGSWLSAMVNFYRGVHGTLGGAATEEWGNELMFNELGGQRQTIEMAPQVDDRARFLDSIETGREPFNGTDWGLQVMQVAQAVIDSAASDTVVSCG